jgi:hypothetical protein
MLSPLQQTVPAVLRRRPSSSDITQSRQVEPQHGSSGLAPIVSTFPILSQGATWRQRGSTASRGSPMCFATETTHIYQPWLILLCARNAGGGNPKPAHRAEGGQTGRRSGRSKSFPSRPLTPLPSPATRHDAPLRAAGSSSPPVRQSCGRHSHRVSPKGRSWPRAQQSPSRNPCKVKVTGGGASQDSSRLPTERGRCVRLPLR